MVYCDTIVGVDGSVHPELDDTAVVPYMNVPSARWATLKGSDYITL